MKRLAGLVSAILLLPITNVFGWQQDFPTFEAYVDYLEGESYPYDSESDWTDNAQGVTNDGIYWYFTQETKLIRVPETADLNDDIYQYGYLRMEDIPDLSEYNHFGDISHYDPTPNDGDTGFILAPVDQGPEGSCALLALFKAGPQMVYVDSTCFPDQGSNAGWVAVDPEGAVYSSENRPSVLRKYTVDWSMASGDDGVLVFEDTDQVEEISLYDNDGVTSLTLHNVQGGVVTPTGHVLYIANGYVIPHDVEPGDPEWEEIVNSWGLHAFMLLPDKAVRIARSCKTDCLFRFEFYAGGIYYEEPEGLTIWEQDFGQAYNIDGQLHVMMLDNDAATDDDIYFKHYTNRQYLNTNDSLQAASDTAWSGSMLMLNSGQYNQSVTFTQKILVEAFNGPVIINGQ